MNKSLRSLFSRDFTLLFSGQCMTLLGGTIYSVVIVLYLKQLTGSATVIGMVELFAFLPWVLLGPFAGALVDRTGEKIVIVLSYLVRGLLMFTLAACSLESFSQLRIIDSGTAKIPFLSLPLPVYAVLVATLSMGTLNSAFNAALYSIIPRILPKDSLQQGNSLIQGTSGVLAMAANALGGIAFTVFGATFVFLLNGAAYLAAAFAGFFLSVGPRNTGTARGSTVTGFMGEVREGFDFIWANKGLRNQTIVYALSNLLFPTVMLSLPFLIEDVLQVGNAYYGYLLSMLTLSSIVGYFGFGALRTNELQNYRVICAIFILEALLFLLLSLTKNMYLIFGLLSLVSICMAISRLINTSLKQKVIPEELRGRVFATLDSINGGLVPLSFGISGVLIDLVNKNVLLVYFVIFVGYAALALWFVGSNSIKAFYLHSLPRADQV